MWSTCCKFSRFYCFLRNLKYKAKFHLHLQISHTWGSGTETWYFFSWKMSYFGGMPLAQVRELTGMTDDLSPGSTGKALCLLHLATGVSLRRKAGRRGKIWSIRWKIKSIVPTPKLATGPISNYIVPGKKGKQWFVWWQKKYLKKRAFEIVADQTGKLMNPDVLTIVWARRFAGLRKEAATTRTINASLWVSNTANQPSCADNMGGKALSLDFLRQ